jgi:hypothetical protein
MQEKLNLFVSNAQAVTKAFKWQRSMVAKLSALLYTLENKPADVAAIKSARQLIKDNFGVFSYFQGHLNLAVSAMLSLSENPAKAIENTVEAYNQMKAEKFHSSDYLAVAALQIAMRTEPDRIWQAVNRARAFYDGMKSRHWFITGADDYIYATMLALSDTTLETGTEKIEELYKRLKPEFFGGNSIQALAEVLALSGESGQAVDKVLKLRDAFKDERLRMDKMYTLPAMGVMALLPVDVETIVRDFRQVRDALKEQKGFGAFSVYNQELMLYVSAIVTSVHADRLKGSMTAALSTSITGIIIAQQAATIAAISASTAAASSSSSS